MSAFSRFLEQIRDWSRAAATDPAPPRKYRVTPRHNPFAFRRALLREAIIRIKQVPLAQPIPLAPKDWIRPNRPPVGGG